MKKRIDRRGYLVMHYAVSVLVLALVAFLAACGKDPASQPEPNPNDTVQPIVPTREIVIPWCWSSGDGLAPWPDTIRHYVQQSDVKHVIIYMVPGSQSTWIPEFFHIAKDSLQDRLNIDTTKVIGGGVVKVGRDGAQIHPDTLTKKYGMWEPDSVWYASHGWQIQRYANNGK